MSNFNKDFLTRQADRNDLGAVVHRQAATIKQVSQAFMRVQSLDEVASQIGELDYRVRDANGVVRMIMSAVNLLEEFGINANFAAFDENGVLRFYVDADDGRTGMESAVGEVASYTIVAKQQGNPDRAEITLLTYADGSREVSIDTDEVWVYGNNMHLPEPYQVLIDEVPVLTKDKTGVTDGDAHQHNSTDVIGTFLNGGTIPASTTHFTCPFKDVTNTTGNQFPWPEGGVLSKLTIRISGTQPASGSLVLTLQVNGSDTALVVTVPAGTTGGSHADTTHTVNFSAGDTITWKVVNNATGTSAGLTGISMLLQKQTT